MKKIHFITLSVLLTAFIVLWPCLPASRTACSDAAQTVWRSEHTPDCLASSAFGKTVDVFQTRNDNRLFWDVLLRKSWTYYKKKFMADNATHVISNNYGGTISEGQSYALLKALWMNEPLTFDGIWRWTKINMARPSDHLLAWRWGEGHDGKPGGVVEIENATDADQDIAYALLLASERWNRPDYRRDGLAMAQDIWRLNVQPLHGKYYLVPGTWSGFRQGSLALNPSYFAPYVYQTFARFDQEHAKGWRHLANDIYNTLEDCSRLTQPGLPPNWCAIPWEKTPDSKAAPAIIPSDHQGPGSRDFSYDAFRVYWRMGMDSHLSPLSGQTKARAYLKRHPFLLDYWNRRHQVPEGFTESGDPRTESHSGFSAGPLLVLNQALNGSAASERRLYEEALGAYYNPEGYWFNDYNDFLHSVIWLHLYALQLK